MFQLKLMGCDWLCRHQRSLHIFDSYLAPSFSCLIIILFNQTEQLGFLEKEAVQFIVDLCAHWEGEYTRFIIFLLMFPEVDYPNLVLFRQHQYNRAVTGHNKFEKLRGKGVGFDDTSFLVDMGQQIRHVVVPRSDHESVIEGRFELSNVLIIAGRMIEIELLF